MNLNVWMIYEQKRDHIAPSKYTFSEKPLQPVYK